MHGTMKFQFLKAWKVENMLVNIIVGLALVVICLEFYTTFKARNEAKIWNNLNKIENGHG